MSIVEHLISCLGKSEQDPELRALLQSLWLSLPLKRPKRGENQVNVIAKNPPLELSFDTAESMPPMIGQQFLEGELLLSSIFIEFNWPWNSGAVASLPFGLKSNESRVGMRKQFGSPSWSSPVFNNDRWVFDGVRVLVSFSEDEKSIVRVNFALDE